MREHLNEDSNEIRKHSVYHTRPGKKGKITSFYDKEIRKEERVAQEKYAELPEHPGQAPYRLSLDKLLSQQDIASIQGANLLVFHSTSSVSE